MTTLVEDPPGQDAEQQDRVKIAREWARRAVKNPWLIGGVLFAVVALLVPLGVVIHYYRHYSALIDERVRNGAFADSINLYAGPLSINVGDGVSANELAAELISAGFQKGESHKPGTVEVTGNDVVITPRSEPSAGLPVHVVIAKDKIAAIRDEGSRKDSVSQYSLGTPLMATISSHREKRHLVKYAEIPRPLVDAVVSIEDKHFFQHRGLDVKRVLKAAYVDMKDGRKEQGASTLTMQLVRGLALEPEKRWKRKAAEAMMTVHLERRWSKETIFETYANQVYLGRQQSFAVHGFGEGAHTFFGKELRDVNLQEAALLAGIVQRPSYFNPFRYPERAMERRNLVLSMMSQNRYITAAQRDRAMAAPLGLTSELHDGSSAAPYFIDLVSEELQNKQKAADSPRDVYTTIDLNLQRAADEALASGLVQLDKVLAKKNKNSAEKVEAALIAIDPHTGEIKAMSGGRDYNKSQLNRILAKRPPGSVFKPFVYAAALNTAIEGGNDVITPATTVEDEPTTFMFAGKPYQPNNFHQDFHGTVTVRDALAHSMNVPAVSIAQTIGYDRVVAMARRAGLNNDIRATPAVALGAYDTTPLEIAGAYTIFSNGGAYVKPSLVSQIRDSGGQTARVGGGETHKALDPRVAYLMVNLLEEVMRSGTAAGVRGRGFTLPAAGKTGTSHDGWFAGFTSQLLCVVWVGYDNYRELNLEGARSALPIWTDFMKRAARYSAYRNAKPFRAPAGLEQMDICTESGKLAGQYCLNTRREYFVAGSEPEDKCDRHDLPQPPAMSNDGFHPYVPVSDGGRPANPPVQ